MSYTTLRVSALGVVLFEEHAARLGPALLPAFERFAASATQGVYSLRANGDALDVERLSGSRLQRAFRLRTAVSPMLTQEGPFPKPRPPSAYDSVRVEKTVTLLTDAAGEEIYESDIASVMAWDGTSLVMVPSDRPRVMSVAEAFVARRFSHRREPIRTDGHWGLLLINAVAVVAPPAGGRRPFSRQFLGQLTKAIEATAARNPTTPRE